MSSSDTPADLRDKISRLELELEESRRRLQAVDPKSGINSKAIQNIIPENQTDEATQRDPAVTEEVEPFLLPLSRSGLHSLLLISDSALPLGSFAFSSGLESMLMHQPKEPRQTALRHFLLHSLSSVARLTVPYLLKAHAEPLKILEIDNDLDASTPCTVARRASIAQGRALLTNWERALRACAEPSEAAEALALLARALRLSTDVTFEVCAHLPPVFGVVAAALGLDTYLTAYAFLLNHVKAVLSAAIRASVLGPFQAQAVLSSTWLRSEIERCATTAKAVTIEDAGQVWVPGDLWIGRHEVLYSRIFNS